MEEEGGKADRVGDDGFEDEGDDDDDEDDSAEIRTSAWCGVVVVVAVPLCKSASSRHLTMCKHPRQCTAPQVHTTCRADANGCAEGSVEVRVWEG